MTLLRVKRPRDCEGPENIVTSEGKRLRVFRKIDDGGPPAITLAALPPFASGAGTASAAAYPLRKCRGIRGRFDLDLPEAQYREIGRHKALDVEVVDVEKVMRTSSILCNGMPMIEERDEEYDLYEEASEDIEGREEGLVCCLLDTQAALCGTDSGSDRLASIGDLASSDDGSVCEYGSDDLSSGGSDWEAHINTRPWKNV